MLIDFENFEVVTTSKPGAFPSALRNKRDDVQRDLKDATAALVRDIASCAVAHHCYFDLDLSTYIVLLAHGTTLLTSPFSHVYHRSKSLVQSAVIQRWNTTPCSCVLQMKVKRFSTPVPNARKYPHFFLLYLGWNWCSGTGFLFMY